MLRKKQDNSYNFVSFAIIVIAFESTLFCFTKQKAAFGLFAFVIETDSLFCGKARSRL